MLHPSTELRFVNSSIGYGVFATEAISKGTIVAFHDSLDLQITPKIYENSNDNLRYVIEHFSYVNGDGNGVLPWDHTKYINHSCSSNILSTGYQLSIAIRDIIKDEEITEDYALLEAYLDYYKDGEVLPCYCGSSNCRNVTNITNIEDYLPVFIDCINEALSISMNVKQPLLDFMDSKQKDKLIKSLQNHTDCSKLTLDFLKKRRSNFHKKWKRILVTRL